MKLSVHYGFLIGFFGVAVTASFSPIVTSLHSRFTKAQPTQRDERGLNLKLNDEEEIEEFKGSNNLEIDQLNKDLAAEQQRHLKAELSEEVFGVIHEITNTPMKYEIHDNMTSAVNGEIHAIQIELKAELFKEIMEVKSELRATAQAVKSEINDLVRELKSEINDVARELKSEINDLLRELKSEINDTVARELKSVKSEIRSINDCFIPIYVYIVVVTMLGGTAFIKSFTTP